MKSFEQPEDINEEQIIQALDTLGMENVGTMELFRRFIDKCMAEADSEAMADPENQEASNRANIKAQIKIGILLSKTQNCKAEALLSLEDARMAASQSDSTKDLAEQILALMDEIDRSQ